MQQNSNRQKFDFLPSGVHAVIPIIVLISAIISLYLWLSADTSVDMEVRVPKEWDLSQPEQASSGPIRGQLINFGGQPSDLPGAWPGFRGADLDAISKEEIPLAKSFPPGGPEVLWSIDLADGFASAAVLNGRVYLIDYSKEKEADVIRCLSLDDGQDIWQYSYSPVKISFYHGYSRTVPAVTDEYLVTIGPKCHVTCLDSITGESKWMLDLVADFGTEVPQWYAGQCPLIDDGKAIIAPSGTVLMMAIDCETGDIIWQTPNPNPKERKMTHSSIIPTEFMGKRMYLYCSSMGVVGISADDGTILWEYLDWRNSFAIVASPLVIGDGRIFLSGGYNAGSMIFQLVEQDGDIIAEPKFWPQFNIALTFQEDLDNGIISSDLRKVLNKNSVILSEENYTITVEEPDSEWLISDGIKKYLVKKEQKELVVCTTRISSEVFGAEQQTPILYEGYIYGLRPSPDEQLVCLDLEGNLVWESSRTNRFGDGLGPISVADDKIYILDDSGTLTLIEPNPDGYVQLARTVAIPDGFEAWGPMAFASGRLIVRDMNRMVCLDIREK